MHNIFTKEYRKDILKIRANDSVTQSSSSKARKTSFDDKLRQTFLIIFSSELERFDKI